MEELCENGQGCGEQQRRKRMRERGRKQGKGMGHLSQRDKRLALDRERRQMCHMVNFGL